MLILKVENLSKIYRYETPGFVTVTVREAITNKIGKILGHKNKLGNQQFYALRDINFAVDQGESVGIIGANGSGKSTLLKILSRITFPSKGEVLIFGKIGALIEVGGGFNQDLTGRENIYLVGSMLGMSMKEIRCKFDEIVSFAGIEQFLDTQVKHFSSGMQVRLSFSIAANYEPEILLLDEVLAVGDAEFQTRCLEKITELKHKGTTLLFVSHELEKLRQLCERTIWLEKGILKMDGKTHQVEKEYLKTIV
ncbi:MAG: ABC transporter ATP-binding protein [Pyrinomonadaceae bacterium]|nr:ABC transporter ATP-binding protein [Pyrinomonadaceae bacterium]